MNRLLHHAAFATGLAAVAWIGAGYVPGSPLALALVVLIAAFYVMGALELRRFHQATVQLDAATAQADTPPPTLADWLARLPASLQPAVRLRIENERTALPGPALTPYLAGLLVLLGMLGTFLGMVATLKGTGLALDHATDLDAIRASLAAPVKGLGLAFGTSVAGVAASAMLGLMSALARRERQQAVQRLDARIASTLRGFSSAHQREESLRLLQAQADVMPALVTQLQGLVAQMAQQGAALHERLVDGQDRFHADTQRTYAALAESVDRSLKTSLADSARIASGAIEPVVRDAMAGLAQEATTLRAALSDAAGRQLDGMAARLDTTAATLADRWQAALADQQRHAAATHAGLGATLDRFTTTFEQRTSALVDGMSGHLDRNADTLARSWDTAFLRQQDATAAQDAQARDAAARLVAGFEQLAGRWQAALAEQQRHADATTQGLGAALDRFNSTFEQRATALIDGVSAHLDRNADTVTRVWDAALARQQDAQSAQSEQARETGTRLVAGFEQHAAALLRSVADAHAAWDAALAERERTRATAFHDGLAAIADTLRTQAGADADALAERQQQICDTLERTAGAITAQAADHARATIDEITRLVNAAAEAPRAAAEVVGELRTALSDSLVRDNAALDERNRLLGTLSSLLDAVNHASTEQRAAIDTLVAATTGLMERAGERFAETVDAESRALQTAAAQVAGGAAEVASLGEGFGHAVHLFGRASENLMAQLQRVETALGASLARSDEQLAYYVAQAREIVDLTLGSQKQIVEDLQQLAHTRAAAAAEADAA